MMFYNPFKMLSVAIENNQKAAENVIKAVDECMGVRKSKVPESLKSVATNNNFARPA